MKPRVVVGMSGGVDSSVTAALLKKEGYDVIGITLKLWPQDCMSRAEDKCCGPQAFIDARAVAHQLDIPYYLIDEEDAFRKMVIDYFTSEYKSGRTPNPCILCNEKMKFGNLLQKAKGLGAEYIATGHYARLTRNGRVNLLKGKYLKKDQSYFLFSLHQDQLQHTLFPLGDLTKEETRALARELGLKIMDKQESMDICFVPDYDYKKFLEEDAGLKPHKGKIVDVHGKVLGEHKGIEFFTIGQRKGLGITSPVPLYVLKLDPKNNVVVVGPVEHLSKDEFFANNCNWVAIENLDQPREAIVKIRYNHPGEKALITPVSPGRVHVRLHTAQRAITPGQAAVFYEDDRVVGGGWIENY